jgi:hypothetical protein
MGCVCEECQPDSPAGDVRRSQPCYPRADLSGRDHVDRGGHVSGEDQPLWVCPEERGQALARLPKHRRLLANEEVHRLLG